MEIIIAENSGFCIGVKRAVDKTIQTLNNNPKKNIYSLGPLIHNPPFIKKLKEKGLKIIDNPIEAKDGIIITRTHGTSKKILNQIKKQTIIDLVCPFVQKIHDISLDYKEKGYQIIIFGEKDHPEIKAIAEDLEDIIIIENENNIPKQHFKKALFVSQTTQEESLFNEIAKKINADELIIKNTICKATNLRQETAKHVANQVNMMIIIGGKNSGNTKRLYNICRKIVKTVMIESVNELNKNLFKPTDKVGISAGASTPNFLIDEVVTYLNEI